jgi:hypothetical protein
MPKDSELFRRMFGHLEGGDSPRHEPSQDELAELYREGKASIVYENGRARYVPLRRRFTPPGGK